jgi:hypothetical protein
MMDERGWEAQYCFMWLETFADVTNGLLKGTCSNPTHLRDAQAHLAYMERKIVDGTASARRTIDVSYVENLMFQFSDKEKRAAWKLFPSNIKALYTAMWGEPGKPRP